MDVTNNTAFVIQIIPPGAIIVTINALNILGNGKESSVTSELACMFQMMSKISIISNVYMCSAESFFHYLAHNKNSFTALLSNIYALFSYHR